MPEVNVAVSGRLAQLLSEITGASLAGLGPESTPETTPEWDSLAMLSFVVAVEEEFDVVISTPEALRVHSLGDMARLLGEKGVTTAPTGAGR
jgi:acyl carrier protein